MLSILMAALLVAVAALAQLTFKQSRDNVIRLSSVELPLLRDIQALDLLLLRAQSDIYEYYLTADATAFKAGFAENSKALARRYERLASEAPHAPTLPDIAGSIDQLRQLGDRFDRVMRSAPIDWDRARAVLESLGPLTTALNKQSRDLSSWISGRMAITSRRSLSMLSVTLTLLSGALLASLAAAITLLWVNRSRLSAMERLHFRALHDAPTGLRNRSAFYGDAARNLTPKSSERGYVALIKIDRLQDVVARGGMGLRDAVIKECVLRMTDSIATCTDAESTLYRIDGNLFALLFRVRRERPSVVADRLRSEFTMTPLVAAGNLLKLTVSIGLAPLEVAEDGPDSPAHPSDRSLIEADSALRLAQQRGGNRMIFFDEQLAHAARRRRLLKRALPSAIANGELHLLYQPQLDSRTGRVLGVEALIRWHHPDLGAVPPAEFILIAEEDQTIIEIGSWVLARACSDAHSWQHLRLPPRISVNLSTRQLEHETLVETVKVNLDRCQLAPAQLEFEITESATLTPTPESERNLQDLRELGIDLAIDDFGTGYSSLSYLHRLPVRRLKIDRSFVAGIDGDARKQASVKAIIALARAHGLETVAEGIETQAELVAVQALGADLLQGYLLARPMTLHAFLELQATHASDGVLQARRGGIRPLGDRSTKAGGTPVDGSLTLSS